MKFVFAFMIIFGHMIALTLGFAVINTFRKSTRQYNFFVDNGNTDDHFLFGEVRKRSGISRSNADNRDSLPYAIFYLNDEEDKINLGSYKLDASVANGKYKQLYLLFTLLKLVIYH